MVMHTDINGKLLGVRVIDLKQPLPCDMNEDWCKNQLRVYRKRNKPIVYVDY